MMVDEIERLRVTVRDLWQERQATHPAQSEGLAIPDREIAEKAQVDVDTVRAFLVSEDGRGLVVRGDAGVLSVSTVDAGYGE